MSRDTRELCPELRHRHPLPHPLRCEGPGQRRCLQPGPYLSAVLSGRRAINRPLASPVVLAALGSVRAEQGIQAVGDQPVGGAGLVLVDERGRSLSWPIRAIRLRNETPMSAARVFPVCRKSWRCSPASPMPVTTCGQPLILLKSLRRSGPPLTPV
jgi:hypothetical protein